MKFFSGKTILLISPQPWNHIFISKHHYAEELVRNNNTVFFLQPPEKGCKGIVIKEHETINGLHLISWNPFFPRKIRFHFYSIYSYLISIQALKIVDKIGLDIDVVWSFDFNLFPDLNVFGPKFSIFHPVDPLSNKKQIDIGKTAGLIISVSNKILNNFSEQCFSEKKLLINHGLSREFSKLADVNKESPFSEREEINVGYFGNLDRGMINIAVWSEIIRLHENVTFNFWGPFSKTGDFYMAIGGFSNVKIHGRRDKSFLVKEIEAIDCFMLIYEDNIIDSDRSNSHKILEYLSTGKVIISSKIEEYTDKGDLIRMPSSDDDNEIPSIFSETINNLRFFNSPKYYSARKDIAKSFTYSSNLEKIDDCISMVNDIKL